MKIEKIVGWKAIVVLLEAIVILYSVLIFFSDQIKPIILKVLL